MNMERIRKRVNARVDLMEKKNTAYGNAFKKGIDNRGLISGLVVMENKMSRLAALIDNPEIDPGNESLVDTLTDIANYSDMMIECLGESKPADKPKKKKKAKNPEEAPKKKPKKKSKKKAPDSEADEVPPVELEPEELEDDSPKAS